MGMIRQVEELLDRYLDQFPWEGKEGEETRFTALDKINAHLNEYLARPEVVAGRKRYEAIGEALGAAAAQTIDKAIMEVLSRE